MKHILLAVTGGIAAYKAIDLTSKLTQAGYEVRVMLLTMHKSLSHHFHFKQLAEIQFIPILLKKKHQKKFNTCH